MGGAIYTSANGDVIVTNSNFTSNTASVGVGGAIYSNKGSVIVINSNFNNNKALYYGGAIYSGSGYVNVDSPDTPFTVGSNFNNNTASFDGGAIYSSGSGDVTCTQNSIFTNNEPNNYNKNVIILPWVLC
jgi:predicted outer membrane repeat protein